MEDREGWIGGVGGERLKSNRIFRNVDLIEVKKFNVQIGEPSDYTAREPPV
jgi:hypothetical protein